MTNERHMREMKSRGGPVKLVAQRRRNEGVYKGIAGASETSWGKGITAGTRGVLAADKTEQWRRL